MRSCNTCLSVKAPLIIQNTWAPRGLGILAFYPRHLQLPVSSGFTSQPGAPSTHIQEFSDLNWIWQLHVDPLYTWRRHCMGPNLSLTSWVGLSCFDVATVYQCLCQFKALLELNPDGLNDGFMLQVCICSPYIYQCGLPWVIGLQRWVRATSCPLESLG